MYELAGPRSFERGRGYLDAVDGLAVHRRTVTATVHGTTPYRVTLRPARSGLDGRCDCPHGQDGFFCKHCVAVGLLLLECGEDLAALRARTADRARALETWLDSLDRARLLDLVREQLAADPEFERRLELRAALEGATREDRGPGPGRTDPAAVRTHVLRLLDTRPFEQYGFVDRRDAAGYAARAAEAARALCALADTPLAGEAATLAREAITVLGEAAERVDDSDGELTGVADALAEAHLAACRAARPDPDDLADWLVTHRLGDTGHLPYLDPADYRDVLGPDGWTALVRRARTARRGNPSGWAEKDLLEQLLRAEGSVDALIGELAADLAPDGHTHLLVAEELDAAGRHDDALAWAERGLAERAVDGADGVVNGAVDRAGEQTGEPYPASPPLVEYLVRRHRDAGRHADVLRVLREHLRSWRSPGAYRRLRDAAREAGRWGQEERDAARALLAGTPALVDALLDDGDADAALAAAPGCGASADQWVRAADAVRDRRPADALAVYRRALAPLVGRTGDAVYGRMTELLLSARACHRALGTEEEFAGQFAGLRAGQRRKRKLMRMLDEAGL
ncbi:hypothetical protein CUT44_20105 [Streptomyces carminius]|uniref:SWIM-type domain-containing protein n=1 Tax=Streptomyces carminius TaxID=2665496 RepID=A0A2M8LWA3_9ACTN|nr:hypothetical protein CUT44_20105 [Streptomyces carminius]